MVQWYWDQTWENGMSNQQRGKLRTYLIYPTKFSKVSGLAAPGIDAGVKDGGLKQGRPNGNSEKLLMLPGTWYPPTNRSLEVHSLERVNQGLWLGLPGLAEGNQVNIYWILKAEMPLPSILFSNSAATTGAADSSFRQIGRLLLGKRGTIQEALKGMNLGEDPQQLVHHNYLIHLNTDKTQVCAQ